MLGLSWVTSSGKRTGKGSGLSLRGSIQIEGGPASENALWVHHLAVLLLWPHSQTADCRRQLVQEAKRTKEAVPTLVGTKDPSSHSLPALKGTCSVRSL